MTGDLDTGSNQPEGLSEAASTPHYLGHRDRLRDRCRRMGADNLSDYELLELVLYRLLPRRDTKPIAKQLLSTFGSFSGVIHASERELSRVSGMGPTSAFDLKLLAAVTTRSNKSVMQEKTILGSWSSVITYCQSAMAHEKIEQFRILFLDKKNKLIADEIQQKGTVDHTPVYPREVIRRSLELNATALILVHNHPSGDPIPSKADIDMTHTIIESAAPMGIVIHDHIIIGKDGHVSMKGLKLI